MKLRVQTRHEKTETIELQLPLEVTDLPGAELVVVRSADGTEYFFDQGGYYDGWGKWCLKDFNEPNTPTGN